MATRATARTTARTSRSSIARLLCIQSLAEFGLAAGAVHDLALQLAAGRIDIVAARTTHGRDHPRVVQQLLEAADRLFVRARETRPRERIERNQVDLCRVLHLHGIVECPQQADEFARMLRLVVYAL